MIVCVYESLIAEKLDSLEDEIKRMSRALDTAKTRDNETVVYLFNTQLAKYHKTYERLCSGSAALRSFNP